ncbi:Peptidoglycan D,D-transpeptidase FtsI [Caulifigura coniformis]|uniref:Peptidoglycan D,D-transpeptidase FtsI n=1 Tax=Caulifigura coniformis TaxID=2527983 RepID=A0A517SGX8_9PLAN|nr:penicillin-binding protein 2 [Caulifigura coniformis]QDT55384.1 Peptidoglycan D,D-transpeptidase FtsI [Caulifigura coniformis]
MSGLRRQARSSRLRSDFIACGLVALWAVIALRLITVQGFGNVASARLARRQHAFVEVLPARPGDISDRAGRLLATSARTESLAIDPSAVEEPARVAGLLAGVLNLDAEALTQRIVASHEKRFLWVKRRLKPEEADAVRSLGLPPDVWHFRVEFERILPQGPLAAHVLGNRDIDNHGRGGVEEGLERLLVGKDGERTLLRDARGYVIDVDSSKTIEPRHGHHVRLTIDSLLQMQVEARLSKLMEECRPLGACVVVLDPKTGEVLSMASRPEMPVLKTPASRDEEAASDGSLRGEDGKKPGVSDAASDQGPADHHAEANGWRNHAIASMFEPGSTFKPFIVAAAIDRGVVQRDEEFHCGHGAYRMGRRVLHDHHSYGPLSVTDILVKSSNIGMAKIGERLENDGLFAAASAFGFGRPTGIELPGELPGQLNPFAKWTSYSTGSIPMGQEIATTPLQVAAAHAALANHGTYLTPHLLLQVEGDRVEKPTVIGRDLVSRETADWLVTGPMLEVVTRGTGKKAQIPGYSVFGKTGTAQKLDPKTGGYSHSRHIGSFACGAPANDPRALVLIAVDEPTAGPSTYGGIVAAPAAADVLKITLDYLGIPPDKPEELEVKAKSRRR